MQYKYVTARPQSTNEPDGDIQVRRIHTLIAALMLCLLACASAEEKARSLFNQAQALDREGKGDEAKKLMERVVKDYPQTVVATDANKFLNGKQMESAVLGVLGNSLAGANEGSARASMRTAAHSYCFGLLRGNSGL